MVLGFRVTPSLRVLSVLEFVKFRSPPKDPARRSGVRSWVHYFSV